MIAAVAVVAHCTAITDDFAVADNYSAFAAAVVHADTVTVVVAAVAVDRAADFVDWAAVRLLILQLFFADAHVFDWAAADTAVAELADNSADADS